MKKQTHIIKQDPKKEIPIEVLASAIKEVADAFERLKNSQLQERAILLLIKDMTGVSLQDIKLVLNAAASLKSRYIKK